MQLFRLPRAGEGLGAPLFSSSGRWLHPLFELEEYLAAHPGPGGGYTFEDGITASITELFMRDRVIGTAAAFLILRLGLPEVEADIMSRRALQLLRERGVKAEARDCVEAIGCATEQLLKDVSDPEVAYPILAERRALALSKAKHAIGQARAL